MMNVYTVHIRRHGLSPDTDIRLVKDGFSWAALVFTFFWTLYHRLWLASVILVAAFVPLAVLLEAGFLSNELAIVGSIVLCLCTGLFGNDERRRVLRNAGFDDQGVVVAASLTEAEQRHFDHNPLAAQTLNR